MLFSINRTKRDTTLFQFSTKSLREFIDPNHILLKIDQTFDFNDIVKPLEKYYCEDNGRKAIHPEIIIRALLVASLFEIPSFRGLVSRISENLAFRYFLYLNLDDEVFDHSTISYFIERVGKVGFIEILARLNEKLLDLGLISDKVYADSTLLKANISSDSLEKTDKTPEEFASIAEEANDLFVTKEIKIEKGSPPTIKRDYFQDNKGQLPLSKVDLDAHWTKRGKGKASLSYKANFLVCDEGFVLSSKTSHANASDAKEAETLLEKMPFVPKSLTADTGYSDNSLREFLKNKEINTYIPLHERQKASCLSNRPFEKVEDKLICSQGKELSFSHFDKRGSSVFVARISDCSSCKQSCINGKGKRKSVYLSPYHEIFEEVKQQMKTSRYLYQMKRRKTVIEGVISHLKMLGLEKVKMRGLSKINCETVIAAFTHNLLKATLKLKRQRPKAIAMRMKIKEERKQLLFLFHRIFLYGFFKVQYILEN